MSNKTKWYKPPVVRGFPAWLDLNQEEVVEEMTRIHEMKENAMMKAGRYPTREYLATLSEEDRLHTMGNAYHIVCDFVEEVYLGPIGQWLWTHSSVPRGKKLPRRAPCVYDIVHEPDNRILLDFRSALLRDRFLAEHPMWCTEKPSTWYDDGTPIGTVKDKYGRNEKYDIVGGRLAKDDE